MKLTKTASGKQTIKMSRKEWTTIGKKAGWVKKARYIENVDAYKKGYSIGEKSLNSRYINKSANPYEKETHEWFYWDKGYTDAINGQRELF